MKPIKCPVCGNKIYLPDEETGNVSVCQEEGHYTARTVICPRCGERNSANNRICARCGEDFRKK